MRLIDADEFRRFAHEQLEGEKTYSIDEILEMIDEQPTAYGIEKVVEEVACNSRFIDDINEHNIKCISCVIGQKTAIDIVKKGGVE